MSYIPQLYKRINTAFVNVDTSYVQLYSIAVKAKQRVFFKVTFTSSNERNILANDLSMGYRIRGSSSGEIATAKSSVYAIGDEIAYSSCMLCVATDGLAIDETIYLECVAGQGTIIKSKVTGLIEIMSANFMRNT